jgi:hypothetical protein
LPRAEQRELVPQDTWRPWAGQRELEPRDTWWPRSCPGLGSGSWSRRARGGPGAALGYAAHAEVMNTRERVICMSCLLS